MSELRFNHVGYIVPDIDSHIRYLVSHYGYHLDVGVCYDPNQDAKLCLLKLDSFVLELVQPVSEKSSVYGFLKKYRYGGMHHICYETDCIDDEVKRQKSIGGLVVMPPIEAVLFKGKRVSFIFTKKRELIELVEKRIYAGSI